MNRIIKIVSCLSMVLCLTGCGDKVDPSEETVEATPLIIISDATANTNKCTEDQYESVADMFASAYQYTYDEDKDKFNAKSEISIIVPDSNPTTEDLGELDETITRNTSDSRDTYVEEQIAAIETYLSEEVIADDEEVDLAGAFQEASTIMEEKYDGQKVNILVLHSGYSTTGALDMTKFYFNSYTTDQVLETIDKDEYPDLTNATVTFINLGNSCGDQQYIRDSSFKKNFKNFYKEWLTDCGADKVKTTYASSQGTAQVYDESTNYKYVSTALAIDPSVENTPWVFTDNQLMFEPNSAEFSDEDKAESIILNCSNSLKEYLEDNPNAKIYVTGHIASDKKGVDYTTSDVSKNRAEAVKALLVKSGISSSNLITVDCGSTEFSWREGDDYNKDGSPNLDNMVKHRCVAIIKESSEDAVKELKDKGYIK